MFLFVSDKNRFTILSIIRDLVSQKLPFMTEEGTQPLIEVKISLGSYLADFLYAFARQTCS